MSKKVNVTFYAETIKNQAKGGAWLTTIRITDEGVDTPHEVIMSAWSNASAAKRFIKEKVQELTPRKSVKMIATTQNLDAKGKPLAFVGQIGYKRDA
jgi:hypothetical protein